MRLLSFLMLLPAIAHARPDTATMSCAAAQALVREKGSVVLSTGRQEIYARYVATASACHEVGARTVMAFVKTSDDPRCAIGSVCTNGETGAAFVQDGRTFAPEGRQYLTLQRDLRTDDELAPVASCRAGRWTK